MKSQRLWYEIDFFRVAGEDKFSTSEPANQKVVLWHTIIFWRMLSSENNRQKEKTNLRSISYKFIESYFSEVNISFNWKSKRSFDRW